MSLLTYAGKESIIPFNFQHVLPFLVSEIKTIASLEFIHSYIWGVLKPLNSNASYRYYIHFMDDYSWPTDFHSNSNLKPFSL